MSEPSRRAVRDEIEAALLEWGRTGPVPVRSFHLASEHERRVCAGILRRVLDGRLAALEAEVQEARYTIARVRDLTRRHRDGSPVPVRHIEMALHGEEIPR